MIKGALVEIDYHDKALVEEIEKLKVEVASLREGMEALVVTNLDLEEKLKRTKREGTDPTFWFRNQDFTKPILDSYGLDEPIEGPVALTNPDPEEIDKAIKDVDSFINSLNKGSFWSRIKNIFWPQKRIVK